MKQDSHQIQKGSAKAIICLLLIIISYKLLLRIISREVKLQLTEILFILIFHFMLVPIISFFDRIS